MSFPRIETIEDLAQLTRLSKGLIYRLSGFNSKFYRIIKRKKKSGGIRIIREPSKAMKAVQSWILRFILDKIDLPDYATGFRPQKNIADNAIIHKGNQFILCYDIEDFFPSISYARVYNVFKMINYNSFICHMFTSLCTCNGVLPQGAITSPALSNIVSTRMDSRIGNYVGKYMVYYSRYADDITLSAKSIAKLQKVSHFVKHIIRDEGFLLNPNKTRYLTPSRCRKITGIVLSDDSMGIGKRTKLHLRVLIHCALCNSKLDAEARQKMIRSLSGWMAFLYSVDKTGMWQLKKYTERLVEKYNITDYHIIFPHGI
ncbi:MAG: retron St85 family RNA-directed DNA polymerase [Promethearchaeota archaeon]